MEMALDHIFNVMALWTTRFGAENMFVWMSSPSESNQVISPKQMKKFALPFHVAYHERLQALSIRRFGIHLCGDQNLTMVPPENLHAITRAANDFGRYS